MYLTDWEDFRLHRDENGKHCQGVCYKEDHRDCLCRIMGKDYDDVTCDDEVCVTCKTMFDVENV